MISRTSAIDPTSACRRAILAGLMLVSMLLAQAGLFAAEPISFRQQVAPLLLDNCVACHGAKKAEGGYRLDTFAELLKAGDSGEPPIRRASGEAGELLRRLTSSDEYERMPAESEPLAKQHIQLIADWVAAGAAYDGGDENELLPFVIPPPRHPDPPASYNASMPITAVAFSADGSQLLVGGYHEITVWNIAEGTLVRRIANIGQRVFAITRSPDGAMLAVACGAPGRSGEVRMIDAASGDVKAVVARTTDVALDVAFRPGSNQLAVASADQRVRVVDLDTLEEVRALASHADWVTAVAWSDDGSRLASASRDQSVKIFDAQSGQLLVSYQGHDAAVRGVAFAPGGKHVLSAGADNHLHCWETETVKRVAAVPLGGEGYKIVIGDGHAWVPCADHRLLQIDSIKNVVVRRFEGLAAPVLSAAWHAPTGRIAAGAFDGQIRVWDAATGELVTAWLAKP